MKKSSLPNQKRVENIKKLLELEGIKEADLARDIDRLPQNLNRDMLSGKISEKTCCKIKELYPKYSIDFLLGLSDHPTDIDELSAWIHRTAEIPELLRQLIVLIADEICDFEKIPRRNIPIYDFYELQIRIHDFADLIISDYFKNRSYSRLWKRIDNQRKLQSKECKKQQSEDER